MYVLFSFIVCHFLDLQKSYTKHSSYTKITMLLNRYIPLSKNITAFDRLKLVQLHSNNFSLKQLTTIKMFQCKNRLFGNGLGTEILEAIVSLSIPTIKYYCM